MVSQRIDGLLVAPQGDGTGSLREIRASGLPVVFVDRARPGGAVDRLAYSAVTTLE